VKKVRDLIAVTLQKVKLSSVERNADSIAESYHLSAFLSLINNEFFRYFIYSSTRIKALLVTGSVQPGYVQQQYNQDMYSSASTAHGSRQPI